jgi:hypothetical protein
MLNCSDIDFLISAYSDNELPNDEKEEIRKHLASCAGCNAVLKFELASKKALRSIPIIRAPSRLRQSILAEITSGALNKAEKSVIQPYFRRLFSHNVAFATAAAILIFAGVFFSIIHFFVKGRMTPFISSVYAYQVENNAPLDIKGTSEEIEKILFKTLEKDIPIPIFDDIGMALVGASSHSDVEGRHCAAIRYKSKNGEEISHFVICCMKVPIENLQAVEGKPEYRHVLKNGINIVFWRCNTTNTTRCIASAQPLSEVILLADDFRARAAKHFLDEHSKKD